MLQFTFDYFAKIWIIWFYQNSIWIQHITQNHLCKYTPVKLLESVLKLSNFQYPEIWQSSLWPAPQTKEKSIFRFSCPWNYVSPFRANYFSFKASKSGNIFCCNFHPKCCILFMYFGLMSLPRPPAFSLVQTFPATRFDRGLAWKLEKGAISWQCRRCLRNEMS